MGATAPHVVAGATAVIPEVRVHREDCVAKTVGKDQLMNDRNSTVRGHLPGIMACGDVFVA